jgi:hypothetical protein
VDGRLRLDALPHEGEGTVRVVAECAVPCIVETLDIRASSIACEAPFAPTGYMG